MKIFTKWTLQYSYDNKCYSESFPAVVPGACQLDYAKYKKLPNYKFSDNVKLYDGLEKNFWKYSTTIPVTNKTLLFYSSGIDYEFEVYIDGEKVYYQEGMFKRIILEIPSNKKGKNLDIIIFPAPKRKDAEKGTRREADRCYKPAVCYGWDFHPRLITQGIWDETYFVEKENCYLKDVQITYDLSENLKIATIHLRGDIVNMGNQNLLIQVINPKSECVYDKTISLNKNGYNFSLNNISLWWSHNYGEQNLYTFKIKLIGKNDIVIDEVDKKIGFRRVKLVSQPYSWKFWKMPFTQAFVPITIELNGVNIFAKGSNFVSPEVFSGLISNERYEELVLALKQMHGNIIRVWGGAIVCKDSFYEICDKEGILVWQDFQLSCNKYIDDSHYLDIVKQEATSIISRLREHPSLSIWCGGNELYIGAENTPQFHVVRLLNSLCFELDKNTPWLDTTPMYGMNHGFYGFVDFYGNECIKLFQRAKATAYTEFGCPSLANYEVLEKIIPSEMLNLESLLKKDLPWVMHGAIGQWDGNSWVQIANIEKYFGKQKDIKDTVVKSQLLQKIGYKFMFEEARRQKYNCSMALNWCFNEPYPNGANNCLISYPLIKKPAYFGVENSLRDKVLSAKIDRFSWKEGDVFKFSLWLLNDGIETVVANTCCVVLEINNDNYELLNCKIPETKSDMNIKIKNCSFVLPKSTTCIMRLKLNCDNSKLNNEYELMFYSGKDYQTLKDSKKILL